MRVGDVTSDLLCCIKWIYISILTSTDDLPLLWMRLHYTQVLRNILEKAFQDSDNFLVCNDFFLISINRTISWKIKLCQRECDRILCFIYFGYKIEARFSTIMSDVNSEDSFTHCIKSSWKESPTYCRECQDFLVVVAECHLRVDGAIRRHCQLSDCEYDQIDSLLVLTKVRLALNYCQSVFHHLYVHLKIWIINRRTEWKKSLTKAVL